MLPLAPARCVQLWSQLSRLPARRGDAPGPRLRIRATQATLPALLSPPDCSCRPATPTAHSAPARRADRILTKAASLHTRPDALGKALRETLREVRTKLRSRDVHRGPSSAASAMSGSGADAGSAESEGRGYDDAGEDAADDDDDASAEPSLGTEVGEDGEDGVVSPAAEA